MITTHHDNSQRLSLSDLTTYAASARARVSATVSARLRSRCL